MRKQILFAAASLAVVVLGCEQGTPGGPGATQAPPRSTTTANRPTYSESDRTFTLSVPVLAVRVKQGDTESATISLSRGRNFDEDVRLEFSGMPKGVTIEPGSVMIARSEKEAKINFHASANAAVGEFTINVTGHPTQGLDAKNEMKLTVLEK